MCCKQILTLRTTFRNFHKNSLGGVLPGPLPQTQPIADGPD